MTAGLDAVVIAPTVVLVVLTVGMQVTSLFVISDLHLGGRPAEGGKPAFQMCTAEGRKRLCQFLQWLTAEAKPSKPGEREVHLVIAGDIVDFLAQETDDGFSPFTGDDGKAARKLQAIFDTTAEVWNALGAFVAAGGRLTLMLGNHDLELSLPGPRRMLLDRLGPGRVEFIYDNQALAVGKVLIEHGNRYDDWNAVPHDALREARSKASRGEAAAFEALPGSELVVQLVNPIKTQLSFIDLLKPEDAALLPFVALFAPDLYKEAAVTLKNRVRALRVRYAAGQQPRDPNYIGAQVAGAAPAPVLLGSGNEDDDALFALADRAAAGGDASMASAGAVSFFERWRSKLAEAYRNTQLDLILKVLRAWRGASERAFDVAIEDEKYLRAATETAARGFDVVIYGHTHLAKRVPLGGRMASNGRSVGTGALYYNSGTWADLTAIPDEILAPASQVPGEARARLAAFVDDLAANHVEKWRRRLPTYVRVELETKPDGESRIVSSALQMLGERGEPIDVTTPVFRAALQGK